MRLKENNVKKKTGKILERIKQLKCKSAVHIVRRQDNRLSTNTLQLYPRDVKLSRRRPCVNGATKSEKVTSVNWMNKALTRNNGKIWRSPTYSSGLECVVVDDDIGDTFYKVIESPNSKKKKKKIKI